MKTRLCIRLLFIALCLSTASHASTVVLELVEARDIEIHERPDSNRGLIIEDPRITFVATAVIRVHVVSGTEDEESRSYIDGRQATRFTILAEDCEFTLYKNRLVNGEGNEVADNEAMENWWQRSIEAFKSLREGKTDGKLMTIHYYEPNIEISKSVAKRISGVGLATLEKKDSQDPGGR